MAASAATRAPGRVSTTPAISTRPRRMRSWARARDRTSPRSTRDMSSRAKRLLCCSRCIAHGYLMPAAVPFRIHRSRPHVGAQRAAAASPYRRGGRQCTITPHVAALSDPPTILGGNHEQKRYPEIPGRRHGFRRHRRHPRSRCRVCPGRGRPVQAAAARLRLRCAGAEHRHGDHDLSITRTITMPSSATSTAWSTSTPTWPRSRSRTSSPTSPPFPRPCAAPCATTWAATGTTPTSGS